CSQNGTDYLSSHYPPYARKIHTAYLGTRDYDLSPVKTDETIELVSCCHLAPHKRIDLLAKSLSFLSDLHRPIHWVHFGTGEGLEDLKKYAEEHLGFMKTEFPGFIRNEDLMRYYQTHPVDWFLNVSSQEGLPVS